MARFRIEIPITLLSVVIAAIVIASGYLGYKSLIQIVDAAHQAARPDNKVFQIKTLAADLSEIENNVRLYVLDNESRNKEQYETLNKSVHEKLRQLTQENLLDRDDFLLVDSVISLSYEKLRIWEGVLHLHETTKGIQPAFSEVYSKIGEQPVDTLFIRKEKKGLFRKIFGTARLEIDTTLIPRDLQREEMREQIESLESELIELGQRFNILESEFISRNLVVSEELNALILEIEKKEADERLRKTGEADYLATITYKRLAAFSGAAVVLLLLVLFLVYNYLRKSRRYQRMLQKAKTEAELYAHAKEQFAANVSHELRTPVNAIYGLSEQMLQKEIPSDTREQMLVLSKSAEHLRRIVNDTLDFSKIQAHKVTFESIHFSPADLFKEIMAIERSEAIAKGLKLTFKTVGTLPEAVVGDPLRIKQILLNLINNSLKFTEKGSIMVEVEALSKQETGYLFRIIVEDTGIGIPVEDQKMIFEEYVQATHSSSRKYRGTGLGLSIVKKLVELQGGSISVDSTEGQGTRMQVALPFRKGDVNKIPGKMEEKPAVPEWFQHLSVLIADDEEFNRFLLKGIFEKWGAACQEADNGVEAVTRACEENFHAVFMDLNMPRKNGLEATREILKEKPETLIIGTTAYHESTHKEACLKAGMSGVLAKPFSEAELLRLLNEKLKNKIITPEERIQTESEEDLNLNKLKRLTNDDEGFFREMLEIFIRSAEKGMTEIERNKRSGNLDAIGETAHKMAAPGKHIQAEKLVSLLQQLENSCRNKNVSQTNALVEMTRSEIIRVVTYIREYLVLPGKN